MNAVKANPLFSHAEFQAEYPIAKELPYWDFFQDRDPPCAVLSDGSLVQGLKLVGLSIETWDANQINSLTSSLKSFLNALPDDADLQFFVDVNSDFSNLITEHERLRSDDPLINWVSASRVALLKRGVESQELQKLNLYLFVYLRIRTTQGRVSSFFTKPKLFEQARKDEFERRAHELSQLCLSIQGNLQTVGVTSSNLSTNETLALIYRTLNPKRQKTEPAPTLQTEHRNQEFLPQELNTKPELALTSPREQLAFSDLIQGTDSFFLDGCYHRTISLKTLPEFTHSSLISRFMGLPFHYTLSVQIQVPEQSQELASLQSKRRMAHSMSISNSGRVTDLESEAKLQSTEELLRDLINTGSKIFYFQTAILLRCETREELDLKTKVVLARIRELNGAEGLAETVAGFKVFKTMLPAGNTTSVRAKRVKTENLADFLPLYQPWEGSPRPVCLLQNRNSGLLSYDPFDGQELPNFNCLVTGSSGSGKSFLNNCILLQTLSQKPLTYVIDIGGSYRKLCEFMRGQYIEITPPNEGVSPIAVNPFLLPQGSAEPSPQKIKFLLALLEIILTDDDSEKIPKLDKSLLEEAILKTYTHCGSSRAPRFSDFAEVLRSSEEQSLKNYAKMLYPWTGTRSYGRLLDAENALAINADMVVFDLKGLSSYPDLQAVMILIITDFILGKVENIVGRQKRILMDECWALMNGKAAHFMEHCARTLRKTGSGITFITQGLEEIYSSPIGPAILNNTATKCILMQRGDLEPIRKVLKLNDQEMALIASLRQHKGHYSEAFLMANERRSIIRIAPTPIEYWLATSDAGDNALLASARIRFPDQALPDLIHLLATHFPRGSQGAIDLPASIENQLRKAA